MLARWRLIALITLCFSSPAAVAGRPAAPVITLLNTGKEGPIGMDRLTALRLCKRLSICLFGGNVNAYTQERGEKGVGDAGVWRGRGETVWNPLTAKMVRPLPLPTRMMVQSPMVLAKMRGQAHSRKQ